jgi:heat shock protein HslJ
MFVLLVAVALTASGCGSRTPVELTGTTWQLMSMQSTAPGEQPSITIADPSKYTVTFGDDGKAGFRVDCNRGNSTWKIEAADPDSGGMTFGPIALTRMACPKPSHDAQVAAALGRVRTYLISGGKLNMSLEADSGIMHWQQLR